jgi:plasmid stabilization system protein ParE
MNVVRADWFDADLDAQYEWYVINADVPTADRFFVSVGATIEFLAANPEAGPLRRFGHPELQGLRFLPLMGRFSRFLIFYRVCENLVAERLLHGYRDLERRLLNPPGEEG